MARDILIIDDKKEKYFAIRKFFLENYPNDELSWTKHFRQAQNNLRSLSFDLIMLDMSFEIHGAVSEDLAFDGLAGLHVLQFMWRSKIYIPTIICTSHENYSDPVFGVISGLDNLESYVRKTFGNVVIGTVLMTADEEKWEKKMRNIIDNAAV